MTKNQPKLKPSTKNPLPKLKIKINSNPVVAKHFKPDERDQIMISFNKQRESDFFFQVTEASTSMIPFATKKVKIREIWEEKERWGLRGCEKDWWLRGERERKRDLREERELSVERREKRNLMAKRRTCEREIWYKVFFLKKKNEY